jgi:pimeloyl-ACP methyl ester carboxylesterase
MSLSFTRYRSVSFLVFFFIIAGAATACDNTPGPIPEKPHQPPQQQQLMQSVIIDEETIYSPAPRDNGTPPPECDYIHFLRYRPQTPDGLPGEVRAVLVLLPGYGGGAASFDYLCRNLVSLAELNNAGSIEVWALERRGNCLEDLSGMNSAEDARNPEIAADYYYFNKPVNGHTFSGFFSQDEVPFLSEFGLQLFMDDIFTVMSAKIPDRALRKNTVFIGGHSLGSPLSALFAGWDRDGNPETLDDAGYNNCAGLIGLEGRVSFTSFSTLTEAGYARRLADIRSGSSARYQQLAGITPEALALLEMMAMYAAFAPDEESTLFQRVPYSRDVEQLIRAIHSRDLLQYLTGVPAFTGYRYTNEALLGIFIDDNFQPVSIMQASLGFLYGGPVVPKTFPPFFADLTGGDSGVDGKLFIAGDSGPLESPGSGPLYKWANFDEIGDAADPCFEDSSGSLTYTTQGSEVTDIQDFARLIFQGPLNFPEWYYASRLGLDMSAAAAPFNTRYGLYFMHQDKTADLPAIQFLASDIKGYDHIDVLSAAVDRPQRRKNEVLEPLLKFLLENSRGSVIPR